MTAWVGADYTYWRRSPMADLWTRPLLGGSDPCIEIGASAHNSFGIPSLNVDFTDELTIWKEEEIRICGHARRVDVMAMADELPFADSSVGFVLNSHVFEHQANPIGCLLEWGRVVRPGGLIYSVIPHAGACEADRNLPLSTLGHQVADYDLGATVETHPLEPGHGKYGHYHRYSIQTYLYLIRLINLVFAVPFGMEFQVVDAAARDDKVGNGYTFVQKVIKK